MAEYQDLLTITGSGPVSLLFTQTFDASASWSDPFSQCAAGTCVFMQDGLTVNGPGEGYWTPLLTSPGSVSQILTFSLGAQVLVQGRLYAEGSGAYLPGFAAGTADFSYSDSGSLFIDVLTPGGGFTSASGATYSATVPEPDSFLLLGLGLASLAGFARFRWRRR